MKEENKETLKEQIEKKEQQMKICVWISVAAAIVMIVLMVVEYAVVKTGDMADWKVNVVKFCTYFTYVMPFVILVPLFVRVSLNSKLYEMKKKG